VKRVIYTIGTSNRRLKDLVEILRYYDIERLMDVRRFPTSSRFPHFKRERLCKSLPRNGMDYQYLGDRLGGFRSEGYEEYTKSGEFMDGLRELEALATGKTSAFFCAEKVFWRCHRRFIADALIERGWDVHHIIEKERVIKGRKREGRDPA
jgi:uncharacterized protein (DUF488 family)